MADDKKIDPFDLSAGVPSVEGDLRPAPKSSDRISKRIVYVVIFFLGVILLIFMVAFENIGKKPIASGNKPPVQTAKKTDETSVVPQDLLGPKRDGLSDKGPHPVSLATKATPSPEVEPVTNLEPGKTDNKTGINTGSSVPNTGGVPAIGNNHIPPMNGQIPKDGGNSAAVSAPLTPEQIAANQAKQDRLASRAAARKGGLGVSSFDVGDSKVPGTTSPTVDAVKTALLQATGGNGGPVAQQPPQSQGQDNEQNEKLNFLKDSAKTDSGYHPYIPRPALSSHEVKIGSLIPMELETGINSNLPGKITARVTEDVYDTVSGCELLIPAMSKVIGGYDSKIALGQDRNLVVWNAMIFKDGSELNLAGMQGYDTSGQAGLQADVDNHYLRMFGMAFGMSMVTAGVQMSVSPNTSTNGNTTTPSQAIATALTQQYGQLGAQMLGKYMAVQPTLRNYPGEQFMIMVPHTITFNKVWRNRCTERTK